MRLLAFVDLETTGLDPARHEILSIGVIKVVASTLAEIDRIEVLVRPERIGDADPEALRINGYTPEAWEGAVILPEALERIAPYLAGAVLAGHNVAFDRSFLEAAWRSTGVTPPEMDHHLIDTATLAWPLLAEGQVDSLSLVAICTVLGIDLREGHRALPDAWRSLQVARRLLHGGRKLAQRAAPSTQEGVCRCQDGGAGRSCTERLEGRSWRCGDGRA